jgi:hypothetical protein
MMAGGPHQGKGTPAFTQAKLCSSERGGDRTARVLITTREPRRILVKGFLLAQAGEQGAGMSEKQGLLVDRAGAPPLPTGMALAKPLGRRQHATATLRMGIVAILQAHRVVQDDHGCGD